MGDNDRRRQTNCWGSLPLEKILKNWFGNDSPPPRKFPKNHQKWTMQSSLSEDRTTQPMEAGG